jgi:hypothetical protein
MQWCIQALPECGTFQEHVHRAIFPAILEAKKMEDQGKPQSVAIAEAVPLLVEAMSKGMACREMCEAAINTCSCGTSGGAGVTFGEAIMNAEKNDKGFAKVRLPAQQARRAIPFTLTVVMACAQPQSLCHISIWLRESVSIFSQCCSRLRIWGFVLQLVATAWH